MAYYSKLKPTVYHEYKNCTVGNNMLEDNPATGEPPIVVGGKTLKLCAACKKLEAAHQGIPGVPEFPKAYSEDVVETYYSKESPEIFHMCQNCFLGQNIEADNLVANQPPLVKNARLCKICVKLCIAGKCITGTPIPAEEFKSTYYSKAYSRPKVFHACQNCYLGKNIETDNKIEGEPDKARLCKICYRLLKEDKCTP